MQDWKLTDKSVAGKNVEHVVLTFKNHHTKLINVHDLGVSVSSCQYRYCDFCDDQGNWSQAVKKCG